ncbi:MAG: putative pyrrolo-quinoline quinone [Rickettsiales bacterium]|jgi:outer membrane protein assembly factor BamB|nr:putative pyrrolo-quinoline quinone [Rickettsiales bacterium]
MKITRFVLSLVVLLLLPLMGCSDKDKKVTTTSSERVAIVEKEKELEPDASAATLGPVKVPPQEINTEWLHSHNAPAIGNLTLPEGFKDEETVSVGSSAKKGYRLSAGPVIANGKVFVLDGKMRLSALNEADIDETLWELELVNKHDRGDAILAGGGLAYRDGVLFATVGFNRVIAVNAENGTKIWERTLPGVIRAAPVVYGTRVIVIAVDNHTYALSVDSGGIQWDHAGISETTGLFGAAPPVVSEGKVILPHSSGELYVLRITDGEELWSDALTRNRISSFTLSDIDAAPVVGDGTVYAVSNAGLLVADDLLSGMRLWEKDIASIDTPWIGGRFLYVITKESKLIAIDTQNGGIRWVYALDKKDKKDNRITWSGPVLAGDKLWVVGSHGKFLVVAPDTGTLKDERKVNEGIFTRPAVVGGAIYLLNNDAKLTKIY